MKRSIIAEHLRDLPRRLAAGGRRGFVFGLAVFGGTGTLLGGFAATGTQYVTLHLVAWIAGSVVVAILWALREGKAHHLPGWDPDGDASYQVDYCTAATLGEANQLTKPFYRHEFVPDELVESWRQRCPQSFVHLTNQAGELCAAFGMIALEESFMKQFKNGKVTDNQLGPEDILPYNDALKAAELYISGVVVRSPDSMAGHRRAQVMLWAIVRYMRALYGVRRKRVVYALAVSSEGENFLRKLRFQVASPAKTRKDSLDLYSLQWDRDSMNRILARVGDYSPMCKFNVHAQP